MMGKNLLLIFLLVVGKTMGFGTWWNTWWNRDLRATTTINYQCSVKGVQPCLDCSNFAYCMSTGTTAYKIACKSGQVCQNQNGGGSCLPYNDTKVTDCKCNGDQYADDFYELTGNKYLNCSGGQAPVVMQCPTGQAFDFTSSTCITPPAIDCSQGGGPFPYGCIGAYFCPYPGAASYEALVIQCPTGELFDFGVSGCVPEEQVKLADFACGDEDGAVADTMECNAFYVCIAGVQQGEKSCCSTGQFFSETNMQCTSDPTLVTCPSKHPCDIHNYTSVCTEPETTTTTTSTIASTTTTTPTTTAATTTPTTTTSTTLTTTTTPPTTTTTPTTTTPATTTTTPTTTTTTPTTTTSTPTTTTTTTSTTTATPTTTTTTTTTPTTTTTTTTANTCGTPSCSADGAFPNTCDCNKYYWCSGGKLTQQSCPSYLHFSAKLRYCTNPAQAGCV